MAKKIAENEITISDIRKEIEKDKFHPIYLFYGDEKFLIDELISAIIAKSLPENLRQLNVEKYSCADINSESFVTAALSIPMLAEKKVVIVKDYEKVNDSKSLQYYLENPSQSTILILTAENIDKRKNVFSHINKKGVLVKSNSLKKNESIEWIKSRFSKQNKKIEADAIEILFELKGESLQGLITEIEKLSIYVSDKKSINKDDVLTVTGSTREFNIFELTNSIGKSDKAKSIRILETLLNQNVEPLFIVSMLSRHFIILWKIINLRKINKSPSEIASIIQVNPYFTKDYISQAEKFRINKIEQCLKHLIDADLMLKSVGLPKKIIINNLIFQLLDEKNSEFESFLLSNNKVSLEI